MLEAFAAGSGAKMAWTDGKLEPGAAVFYGVREPWVRLWEQCKAEGRNWHFVDNSYFDVSREKYFRITKNAIQHKGIGESDGKRFAKLGVEIKPMREGSDIVICTQSPEFMRVIAKDESWLDRAISKYSGHRLIVRSKADKRPLLDDLKNAALLVTWSSAAAVTALLEGVEVVTGEQCCAHRVEDRRAWAEVLADNQWTLEEMAGGVCGMAG